MGHRGGRESSGASHGGPSWIPRHGASFARLAVIVVGSVGDDADGETIRADLARFGVDVSAVDVVRGRPTGLTVAIVRPDGERASVSHFGSLNSFNAEDVRRHWDSVEQSRAACFVGLFNLPELDAGAVQAMLARLRHAGTTTVLDPGWDPGGWQPATLRALYRCLPEVDLLLINRDEAAAMTRTAAIEDQAEALVSAGWRRRHQMRTRWQLRSAAPRARASRRAPRRGGGCCGRR